MRSQQNRVQYFAALFVAEKGGMFAAVETGPFRTVRRAARYAVKQRGTSAGSILRSQDNAFQTDETDLDLCIAGACVDKYTDAAGTFASVDVY